jgi:hypothetical protein
MWNVLISEVVLFPLLLTFFVSFNLYFSPSSCILLPALKRSPVSVVTSNDMGPSKRLFLIFKEASKSVPPFLPPLIPFGTSLLLPPCPSPSPPHDIRIHFHCAPWIQISCRAIQKHQTGGKMKHQQTANCKQQQSVRESGWIWEWSFGFRLFLPQSRKN